jgi:Helix-turn-helix
MPALARSAAVSARAPSAPASPVQPTTERTTGCSHGQATDKCAPSADEVQAKCRRRAAGHHRSVNDLSVGTLFRAVRIRRRLRQVDVADAAGVPRWCVSRVEQGHLGGLPLDRVRALADALEIRLDLDASWRGADGARIVNERHSRMHELVAARLAATPGWEYATEVTFSEFGERGTIDILAWHPASRTLLVIELKTEIPDPAGLVAQVDRYRRLARQVGRARGWDPLVVAAWVLVAESDLNRDQLARHRRMLRNAFPLDGRFLRRWLRDPAWRRESRGGGAGGVGSVRGGAGSEIGGAGGRVRGGVSGLSFLANVTGGSTTGTLGPTKRVRGRRTGPGGPETLTSDQSTTPKRGNRATTGRPSTPDASRPAATLR